MNEPKKNDRWGGLPPPEAMEHLGKIEWQLQWKEAAWGSILGKVNKRVDFKTPLISVGLLGPMPLGDGTTSTGGELVFGYNLDVYLKLPIRAQHQALMIAMQKVLNGQLSSMGRRIATIYGEFAAEVGLLMALTGSTRTETDKNGGGGKEVPGVEVDALEAAGFWLPKPEDLKLEGGRAWEWYASHVAAAAAAEQPQAGDDAEGEGGGEGTPGGKGKGRGKNGPLGTAPEQHYDSPEDVKNEPRRVLPSGNDLTEDESRADTMMEQMVRGLEKQHNMSGRGLVAGEGVEWIKVLFAPPQEDWRKRLRQRMTGAGQAWRVITRQRLTRRGDPSVYFGRKTRGGCCVLFGMDTSGSRSERHMQSLFPELRAAKLQPGTDIWLAQVDASVQDVRPFTGAGGEFEMFGRGGTAMQPFIDAIPALAVKAGVRKFDLVVLATDGFTDENDWGDHEALVLLDSTGAELDTYVQMVKGSKVDVVELTIDDDPYNPDKLIHQ